MRRPRATPSFLSRLRRAGAVAATLVMLAGMLAVQAREATVVHVRCVEHGQLMHVEAPAHAAPTARTEAGTHVIADQGGARAGHDHCLVVGANHYVHAAAAPVTATEVAALEHVPSVAPAEHLARATFRLAPKTSPPV